MDRYLRPDRFDTDINSPDASRQWTHWLRTFQAFLKRVQVEDSDKLDMLVNFLSSSIYEHIAECDTFENAISVLHSLYVRPKSEIFARYLLTTCRQECGQSIDQFVQNIKTLSKDCNFRLVSAEEHRDEAMRDALITGLQSNNIRTRLLEQPSLTLETAYNMARSLESAQKQSQQYGGESTPCALTSTELPSNMSQQTFPTATLPSDTGPILSAATKQTCYFCGYSKHPRSKCPARDAVCKTCGKTGHYQRVCKSKSFNSPTTSAVTPFLSCVITAAAPPCLSRTTTKIVVNNVELQALIDTGSSESYISHTVATTHRFKINPCHSRITMASTSLSCFITGYCFVTIRYGGVSYDNIKLSVMSNLCADVLLGHDFLQLHDKIEIPFGGNRGTFSLCSLTAANIQAPPLFAHLSPKCTPIATKSRRHSVEDERFIKTEIERLLRDGIIETSNSPWRAQVLVTRNVHHKRRMVVDYSQTVNRFTFLDAYPLPRIDEMVQNIAGYEVYSTLDLKSAYHQIPIAEHEKQYTAFEACGTLFQFRRIPFGVTNGVACFQRTIDEIIKTEGLTDTFAYIDNVTVCGKTKEHHDQNLERFMRAATKYGITFNDSKSVIATREIQLLGYQLSKGLIKPDPERMAPLRQLPPPADPKAQQRAVGMFAYYSQWIPQFSDKINPLVKNKTFPLPPHVNRAFEQLKTALEDAMITTIDYNIPLVVETDASDVAIAATLSQNSRPVAFFSRTLNPSEKHHSAIEKEAYAIVEAVRKWRHYLLGRHFRLITDQRSVAFMYDMKQNSKIKNDKIQRWRLELAAYHYDITYRPGRDNQAADTFSRNTCASVFDANKLRELHDSLCHPGITRMIHLVRSKNLPYSVDEIKHMTSKCGVCAELKPRFHTPPTGRLIKATQPFERLSIDFKGPLPQAGRNRYLLTVIDEYSRFPFAFACPDMLSSTVINCLCQLFAIFGMPAYIHSDRGSCFMSSELSQFLQNKGVSISHTTAYNPQGNGQVERLNGTLWKTISLALKSRGLPLSNWESVLPDALHSIRSLLCTATNATPHERLFRYDRRSSSGASVPTWLTVPGPVLLKRMNRSSKYDPLVEEVELVSSNPYYATVKLPDGKEESVSVRRLAPRGDILSPTFESDSLTNIPIATEHETPPHAPNPPENKPIHKEQHNFPSTPSQTDNTRDLICKQQRTRAYNLRNREA